MVQALLLNQLQPSERTKLSRWLDLALRAGRPCCVLAVHVDTVDWIHRWASDLPGDAEVSVLGPRELLVGLPGCHLDPACAWAERLVRLHQAKGQDIFVGVAEALPRGADLERLIGRAEEALRLATEGSVGSVVSMNWADWSQDLHPR